jgi:hypothetical protein
MAEAIKPDDITIETKHKEKLIELVKIDNDRLEFNQDAYKLLNSIQDDIVVISIIGEDNQDKTFLQSLLLDNVTSKGVNIS